LFGLNIYMHITSEKDFPKIRQMINRWKQRFPMFKHDVIKIENIVEQFIKKYSEALIGYRQTHKKIYLERAQEAIDEINRVLLMVEKVELMALLSKR